jgi:hypothetical protein
MSQFTDIQHSVIDIDISYQLDIENYQYIYNKLGINTCVDITDMCVICRDKSEHMLQLGCTHTYCTQCLIKWLYIKHCEAISLANFVRTNNDGSIDSCCYCFKRIDFKLVSRTNIINVKDSDEICVIS